MGRYGRLQRRRRGHRDRLRLASPSTTIIFNTAGYALSGGSLVLSGSGAAITANANVTINSTVDMGGGAAQIGGSGNITLGGTVQDGSLAKIGAGVLTLLGTNTYSGGTTISGGTLQVGDGVANNGVLPGNVSNNATLVLANPSAVVYGGAISGSGALTKAGAGTLTITSTQGYTGPTVISAGTLRMGALISVSGFGGNGTGYTVTTNSNSLYTTNDVPITNNVLTLTDGHNSEGRSVFYNTPLAINAPFAVSFVYQAATGTTSSLADGVAFVLQNSTSGPAALGGNGGSLGYAGISPSVGITLNIYSGAGGGVGSEYVTAGTIGNNSSTSPVNLASKDPIQVSLTYDGSNFLVESLKDLSTSATFSTTFNVGSLASVVGGSTAYAGFTGATGGDNATQTISSFSSNLSYMASAAGNNMLPTSTALSIAAGATLDLYGGSQTVGSLSGAGAVTNTRRHAR